MKSSTGNEAVKRPSCEHGYYFDDRLNYPPPCGCRPVVCFVCQEQMYYDGEKRYEPEFTLTSSTDRREGYVHKRCVEPLAPEMVTEVQRRIDAVIDAAVTWHQGDGDVDWADAADALGVAIDSLLELRSAPDHVTRATPSPTPIEEAAKRAAERVYDDVADMFAMDVRRGQCVDSITKMITAEFASPAQGWESIDSAPKDGTRILVWVPESENVLSVYWDAEFESKFDETDTQHWIGAWTDDAVKSFGYEETESYNPTHWMPLPPAPRKEAAQEEKTK